MFIIYYFILENCMNTHQLDSERFLRPFGCQHFQSASLLIIIYVYSIVLFVSHITT